jgi:glycosyltransferase involved in cell wall biosynthesis
MPKNNKKIAVFHNYLDNMGGAEFVALTIAKALNSDIYTTNIDKDKISRLGFKKLIKNKKIKSIGKIPINAPFRQQLALRKFRNLNLKKTKKYDFFIIAGDWAMSGAVNNKPNMWYVHSPLNELWAFRSFVRNKMLNFWKKPLFDLWVIYNRFLTKKYSKHINNWICNSANVKKRINKYYNQKLENIKIINPPVNTSKYKYKKPKNYWLSVTRFTPYKRLEIQLRAFSLLPNENLIIAASYEKGSQHFEKYKCYLEKIQPKNVKFVLWPNRKQLIKLYSECKGFIATSRNEDFCLNFL